MFCLIDFIHIFMLSAKKRDKIGTAFAAPAFDKFPLW